MEFNNIDVVVSGPNKPSSTYKTKVLKGNHSFASQVTEPNTKYVIKYNFVLDGDVTIPKNCILEFDGGSLNNGTLIGNYTCITADKVKIFGNDLNLSGNFNVKESYPEWFGVYPDDSTINATPTIKKLVAAGMPIQFSDGTYYLSECLLQGVNIVLKGTGTHYKRGTIFKAFYPNSAQRFILKLGGREDFDNPGSHNQNYHDIWCSNFILDGIYFRTYDTTLINADTSGVAQNYAAVCFDWAVEGYVDIKTGGACPGVFIANSWEIYFECLCLYGSETGFNESALYIGKAYTDFQGSNISAITINNLFAEAIYGKVVGTYSSSNPGANICDLIINNIEFEPYAGDTSIVSHTKEAAYTAIGNNIHKVDANTGDYTMDVQYYFEFGKEHTTIHSLVSCAYSVTYKKNGVEDAVARGLINALDSWCNIYVDKIVLVETDCAVVIGAGKNATVNIGEIVSPRWSGNSAVYTRTNPITDVTNVATTGVVKIGKTTVIVDKDEIKEYGSGLLFNAATLGEVATIKGTENRCFLFDGMVDGRLTRLVYLNFHTLDRKFKFKKNAILVFNYTAPNKWVTKGNVIVTYYKNDAALPNPDQITLEANDTQVISNEYEVYTGDYDYCTIGFNSFVSIVSVEVRIPEPVSDSVLMFPSQITSEVKDITSHYTGNDVYMQTALQYFFNKIASFRSKLKHIILPVFARTTEEAIYDIVTGTDYLPISGNNHLVLNTTSNRLHLDTDISESNWSDGSYRTYAGSTFDGTFAIMSATDGIGGRMIWGEVVQLNSSSVGLFEPMTTDNQKIIGCGIVDYNGDKCVIRLGDKKASDKITRITEIPDWWDYASKLFGNIVPNDLTNGVRILVTSDEKLTADEAKILRDAVIELDDKFAALDEVNDNYTLAVEKLLIPNSGIWNDKPSSANISVGFAYFCTDKHTEEGATDGIMIYYKGQDTTDPNNSVDVWVDALGRVVS